MCSQRCTRLHIPGKMPALAPGHQFPFLYQILPAAGTAGSRIPGRGLPLPTSFPACARWRGWTTALTDVPVERSMYWSVQVAMQLRWSATNLSVPVFVV